MNIERFETTTHPAPLTTTCKNTNEVLRKFIFSSQEVIILCLVNCKKAIWVPNLLESTFFPSDTCVPSFPLSHHQKLYSDTNTSFYTCISIINTNLLYLVSIYDHSCKSLSLYRQSFIQLFSGEATDIVIFASW